MVVSINSFLIITTFIGESNWKISIFFIPKFCLQLFIGGLLLPFLLKLSKKILYYFFVKKIKFKITLLVFIILLNPILASTILKKETSDNEDIKIVKINDNNFEAEILNSKKPVILEISSTSCPPCLIMIPTLISIAKNYSDIKIASVGIDEPHIDRIKASLPIQAFPTFFFIKDGKIINKLVGVVKEGELLAALQYTPKKINTKGIKKKNQSPKLLVCKTNGQFNGLKNLVTISFVFGETEIENVDIITDVFVPLELNDQRERLIEYVRSSGKGEVTPTMTGFQMHIDNDCRFMKAMDMKRSSTYSEMRAGLELQGFVCN